MNEPQHTKRRRRPPRRPAPKTPPRPTAAPPRIVDLRGAAFAVRGREPLLIRVHGSDERYLACFTRPAEMPAFYVRAGLAFDAFVQIEDEDAFYAAVLPTGVIVILDPYFTPDGRLRYLEGRAARLRRPANES